MSGRIGDLSEEQEQKLSEMKEILKDVLTERCDDKYILRFLRSRGFDVKKASDKLRETLIFRQKYGADSILTDYTPPPLLVKHFPAGILEGIDRTGHGIGVMALGLSDPKGLLKSFSREELFKYKVYSMEMIEKRIQDIAKETGKGTETMTFVIDVFGLSSQHLWKPGLQLFSEFLQLEEKHYPELAHRGFIIRAPRIFPTIYALVKPFIDPNTRQKLEICSSNFQERLAEFIDPSALPSFWGGSLEETSGVSWGGKIPLECYKENDESLQHQYVKPGKSFEIEVEVKETGLELYWEFVTENHDIIFKVEMIPEGKGEGEKEVLVEPERIAAHLGNVEGSVPTNVLGTYILKWDNSFSWTRGKNLKYKFELIDPKKGL